MGDLSNFERGQIVGACLAGESVTKTVTLLGVSRATVSKVMSAYMNHGKTTSVKRDSGQKSTLTERDHCTLRRIVSKNNSTTAVQVMAKLNIYFKGSVSTESVRHKLYESNIHGVMTITPGHLTTRQLEMRDMVTSRPSCCSLHQE
jgi:transposase